MYRTVYDKTVISQTISEGTICDNVIITNGLCAKPVVVTGLSHYELSPTKTETIGDEGF